MFLQVFENTSADVGAAIKSIVPLVLYKTRYF